MTAAGTLTNQQREQLDFEASLASECDMLEAELRALRGDPEPPASTAPGAAAARWETWRRSVDTGEPLAALCLSGGGIRSATFSLGVLQGLARRGWLGGFHYLSTVSGGGYVGGFLSAWIQRTSFEDVVKTLQQPIQSPPSAFNSPIGNLRAYSNYLSPMWGVSADLFTLLATYLRNLTLNWLQLVSLICATLMLPRFCLLALGVSAPGVVVAGFIVFACLLVAVSLGYMVSDLRLGKAGEREPQDWFGRGSLAPLAAAALIGSWCLSASIDNPQPADLPQWLTDKTWWPLLFPLAGTLTHVLAIVFGELWREHRHIRPPDRLPTFTVLAYMAISGAGAGWLVEAALYLLTSPAVLSLDSSAVAPHGLYAIACVPAALCGFWLVNTIAAGVTQRWTTDGYREWWARAGGGSLAFAIGWIVLFGAVIYAPPFLLTSLAKALPDGGSTGTIGLASGLLGLVTSGVGYWSRNGGRVRQMASRLGTHALELAAAVFIALLALLLSVAIAAGIAHVDKMEVPAAPCAPHARGGADVSIKMERVAAALIELRADPGDDGCAKPATTPASAATPRPTPAEEAIRYRDSFDATHGGTSMWILLGLVVTCLTASYFFGANVFSLHGLYKNRLERAYLGASNRKRHPHWFTGFDDNDNLSMTQLASGKDDPGSNGSGKRIPTRLLPVVNIALNLARPSRSRLSWQQRKAASFTVTPRFTGSSTLGYLPTESYAASPRRHPQGEESRASGTRGFTLARAMTISGAAASPNQGYHTSTLVAFVMTFFNVRLGWWAPNPRNPLPANPLPASPLPATAPGNRWLDAAKDRWAKVHSEREPSFSLLPMLRELTASSSEDNEWVYLSDGGHFENLGLYEMVRRRCRHILVVDAGCDPDYTYEDLENALRKIRIDFGVTIDFDGHPLPRPRAGEHDWSRRTVFGRIRYGDKDMSARREDGSPQHEDGVLVLIKPVLLGDEPIDVLRYAGSRPPGGKPFPQESTADQFFSEAQFESYRALGEHSVMSDLQWWPGGRGPDAGKAGHPPSPLPPLPPAAARPAPAASGSGQGGGVGQAIGSMAGAARQAAVVVGLGAGVGAVGLGVAHFSGEVHLDAESSELLRKPLTITIPPVTLDDPRKTVVEAHVTLDSTLLDSLKNLTERLAALIDRLPPPGGEQRVLIKVEELTQAINKAELKITQLPDKDGKGRPSALADILIAVQNLQAAVTGIPTNPPAPASAATLLQVNVNLEDIRKELRNIESRLASVRATSQGAQR